MFHPKIIILGPGGMKGIMELGALQKLHEQGCLNDVERFVGCSIGTIISLLYICGYLPYELLLKSKEYCNLLQFLPEHMTIKEYLTTGGIIPPKKIKETLDILVKNKLETVPTLAQLKMIRNISLTVVYSNIETCTYGYINEETHPNMLCTDAAIIGINIPGLISSGYFDGIDYTDGALTNPYPINIYDDGDTDILGIFIQQTYDVNNFFERSMFIYVNMTIASLRNFIIRHASNKCKHLELKTNIQDPTGIFIRHDEREDMYSSGYKECDKFLKNCE